MAERDLPSTLTALFVYAPVGISEKVRTDFDSLVASGRQRVQTARWVGEMALNLARQKGPGWVSGAIEQAVAPVAGILTGVLSGVVGRSDVVDPAAVVHEHHEHDLEVAAESARSEEPFEGYDHLAAAQIVRLLDRLPESELEMVRTYEAAHRGRRTILAKVEQLSAR